MLQFIYLVLGCLGGVALATQSGVNSLLRVLWAKHPMLSAAVSFTVGAAALLIMVIVLRVKIPSLKRGEGGSNTTLWWHWFGGVMGAYLVAASIFLVPIVGASVLVALILAGNLGAAVVLDHFGIIGFKQRSINAFRIFGIVLLAVGVCVVSYFK